MARVPSPSTAHVGLSQGVSHSQGRTRPLVFLVSTTPCARNIGATLGAPAYSYFFVVEALSPVLERIGTWRLVERPESRLPLLAAEAASECLRPIHLVVNPLQDAYLCPALPNIVFPFWEFPEIPNRDFGDDTRQNWLRICRSASMILTACRFTAAAFERIGLRAPVAVVPIPVAPRCFELPPWELAYTWTLTCRHELLGSRSLEAVSGLHPVTSEPTPGPRWRRHAAPLVRGAYRQLYPWLGARMIATLTRLKMWTQKHPGKGPRDLLVRGARDAYRHYVRQWISADGLQRIHGVKAAALALIGRTPSEVADPPLPSSTLTIGDGLTYLTFFNVGDERKNYVDLLSAFLAAFSLRPDVTLVIKLVTNRQCEQHEAGILRAQYERMTQGHACRIVVVTEYLDEPQMDELFRVATYYVNTSHAEGACLPLMRALAGGRPAIAPTHTAMADYMNDQVGFVLRSHEEPTHWPHDPAKRLETTRNRLIWTDIRDAFLLSADVALHRPMRYQALADAARRRMAAYASYDAAETALRAALERLPDHREGAFGWERSGR